MDGFTLLEILVALSVFALAVLGLMGAFNSIMSAGAEARTSQIVRERLENQLSGLEQGKLVPGEKTIKLDSPDMTLRQTVRQERVAGSGHKNLEGFWRVTIRAEWSHGGGGNQEDEISILRYAPQ